MRADTKKMISSFYLKRKMNFYQNLLKYFKKPIPTIALVPAFAAGFLVFVIFNPFLQSNLENQNILPQFESVNTLKTSFNFDKNTMVQMENILNQKNINVDTKIQNLETVINNKYLSLIDDFKKSQTKKMFNLKNASVIINEEDNECFSIEILSKDISTKKLICKAGNNEWEFNN